jgi:hypothetical protein
MSRFFITLIFLFITSTLCLSQRKNKDNGVLVLKSRVYDTLTNSFIPQKYWRDIKLWFYDSTVIQEGSLIEITEKNGIESVQSKVTHYTYIDLRRMVTYNYKHFSDTAICYGFSSLNDSLSISNGWDFLSKKQIISSENRQSLPDTVLDRIRFKRYTSSAMMLNNNLGEVRVTNTLYMSCNKKFNPLFSFERPFNETINCPVVKSSFIDHFFKVHIFKELDYLPRRLNKEELKVFEQWKKNADLIRKGKSNKTN